MRRFLLPAAVLLPMLADGCAAKTAFDVVTFPVKATSKAVDWSTTSQSEADRNAGRKARKEREKAAKDCRKHGGPDCGRIGTTRARAKGGRSARHQLFQSCERTDAAALSVRDLAAVTDFARGLNRGAGHRWDRQRIVGNVMRGD